jgi:hypothetical protein
MTESIEEVNDGNFEQVVLQSKRPVLGCGPWALPRIPKRCV